MSGATVPEYLFWIDFLKILAHEKSNNKIKNCIIENLPARFVLAFEELAINLKNYSIPLSNKIEKNLLKYRHFLRILADPKKSVQTKRKLLQTSKGLRFLSEQLPDIIAELRETVNNEPENSNRG